MERAVDYIDIKKLRAENSQLKREVRRQCKC